MNETIRQFLGQNEEKSFSIQEIMARLKIESDYSTVFRHMQQLLKQGDIKKEGRGRSTRYKSSRTNLDAYFEKPFFQRNPAQYQAGFLGDYVPNKTHFIDTEELKKLNQCNKNHILSTEYLLNNKRLYENLLIDLSYSSSYLEGNTYSYLDTEVLIKYGEAASGKSKEETAMILNHKNAIEYIVKNKHGIELNKKDIFNLHGLLGKNLLDKHDLGVIRKSAVKIGGSAYGPLNDHWLLEEQFNIFIKKLNAIRDPFEQCFFILVFIPYFQLFKDINKRTSRLFGNVPLLKNNLVPFSFLMVDKKAYITGLLAIYELNNIEKLKEVFITAYVKTCDRYFE